MTLKGSLANIIKISFLERKVQKLMLKLKIQ
jgi:hypothetical protein